MKNVLCVIHLSAASASARRENFMGRSFRVVPAVMVRSQVLNNNMGRTFLPPDEVTDAWASVWNGIPVLVGPHPEERGQAVSGRSPSLWNARCAGWLFNVSAGNDGNARALRGEVWLDESRAEDVPGLTAVLERVDAGEPVELSTGFPAQSEEVTGVHNGENYDLIMHPVGADHLVISTEMTGACAVADGCGLGVNSEVRVIEDKSKGEKNRFMAIFEKVSAALTGPTPQQKQWDENTAIRLTREVEMLNATPLSDQDRWNMLREALQAKMGGSDRHVAVMDVYSEAKQVVFYVSTPMGPQPPGSEYFRATYAEAENGALTFSDPERVRRMTSYEPSVRESANLADNGKPGCGCHNPKQEDALMQENEKKELVTEISTSLAAQFADMIKPVQESIATITNAAKEAATAAVNAAVEGVKAEFKTQLDALNAKVDGALAPIVAEREAEKTALVEQLSSNERTPFTKEELAAKPIAELHKLAVLANVPVTNFAGRGGPRQVENSQEEPSFMEPVPYFQKAATNSGKKE